MRSAASRPVSRINATATRRPRLAGRPTVSYYSATREREILQMIAEGRSNKEVANLLNISPTTVETHRGHILQKLDIHSVPELILYAVRKGIIS